MRKMMRNACFLCLFIRDTENVAKIRKNIENKGIMSVKKFNA